MQPAAVLPWYLNTRLEAAHGGQYVRHVREP